MHLLPLLLALCSLGSMSLAAPSQPYTSNVGSVAPPGCIGWVWALVQICIVAPPTTTIGPSTKRNDNLYEQRDVDNSSPFRVVARHNEHQPLADRGSTTPTATSALNCIPLILEQFKICIIGPPTTTIVPSTKMTKRDWFSLGPGSVTISPDQTIPGGALVPDTYNPGGALVPDKTVSGGSITHST